MCMYSTSRLLGLASRKNSEVQFEVHSFSKVITSSSLTDLRSQGIKQPKIVVVKINKKNSYLDKIKCNVLLFNISSTPTYTSEPKQDDESTGPRIDLIRID